MSDFIQLHILTSYPPGNINRDDTGRPKTARMGGFDRLRISSQSLKRSWRTSSLFQEALAGHVGHRTRLIGNIAFDEFKALKVDDKPALEWSASIAGAFGKVAAAKPKDPKELRLEQLVHISPDEEADLKALVRVLAKEQRKPSEDECAALKGNGAAADIAMFGRMLAASPKHNVEAACQVAHALSVHSIVLEEDYFTAVDDLNDGSEDIGSAHIGETGFAAALFYANVCINRTQLVDNLGGDEGLANKAIRALTEATVKVSPSGKQNSFGTRAYANYVLAEKGGQQPRSLSVAFLTPVDDEDMLFAATAALAEQTARFDLSYGACADSRYKLNTLTGEGNLDGLLDFVTT